MNEARMEERRTHVVDHYLGLLVNMCSGFNQYINYINVAFL